jgi:uncharacterized membrane protein
MNRYCCATLGHHNPLRQRGIVMPMLAVSLVALMAMGGLALDSGHLFVNKSALQNAVDAAALSAAKVLKDNAGDTAQVNAAWVDVFNQNQYLVDSGLTPADFEFGYALTYSTTPVFSGGALGKYVRVEVTHNTPFAFVNILPGVGTGADVRVSAVAGPLDSTNPDSDPVLFRDFTPGAES